MVTVATAANADECQCKQGRELLTWKCQKGYEADSRAYKREEKRCGNVPL